ncbi:MAG: tRNA preQ1(34) S-adenosylmethionine ribosyltransferase-isomerase QueA [Planctomycetota bacterium]
MMEIDQYDYELPRELIAQEPLPVRSDARLMIVDRKSGAIQHSHVRDLREWLQAEDTLVLNNSRVIPAKMVGYRTKTEGRWQGLFLRSDPESGVWEILTKTRGTLNVGETITLQDREGRDGMMLEVVARTDGGHLLVLPRMPTLLADQEPFGEPGEWLDRYGRVPLPPYIRDGHMVDADTETYQTVFAKDRGSVAAPTAGLHFTPSLLDEIRKGQIEVAEVTLHVGIGTFRPIAVERLSEHQMHEEWGRLDNEACGRIQDRRQGGGRCVAVGTTSVRVLESASADGTLKPWTGMTDLFIKPPYQFNAVDALMTNFHLPKSSLLVLVSAFASAELIRHAYRAAVEEEYRFFSYGDAMLIV